jgi:hypothetical protein
VAVQTGRTFILYQGKSKSVSSAFTIYAFVKGSFEVTVDNHNKKRKYYPEV